MSQEAPRLYGVSYGDGNNGVSHIFADFYVKTNDPWRLAHLALVSYFKPEWQAKAMAEMDIDGDSNYTVVACLYEPLDREPEEDEEDEGSYCDTNGAYFIAEVFPEDDPREGRPTYDSLEEAFDKAVLEKVQD